MRHSVINRKKFIKQVTADAISILLDEAEKNFEKSPSRSKKYVKMAFNLIKKHRLKLSRNERLRFCKKCFLYWIPEKTVQIIFEKKHNSFLFICHCGTKRRIITAKKPF